MLSGIQFHGCNAILKGIFQNNFLKKKKPTELCCLAEAHAFSKLQKIQTSALELSSLTSPLERLFVSSVQHLSA